MREVEDLLRRERESRVLEVPDARYTAAAVKRRLGRAPAQAPHQLSVDWAFIFACCAMVVGGALTVVVLGLNPWWLLLIPSSAIPLFPILLRKGAR